MKNKSSRHKETNTFKFQPFAERIANIDIDIFHKIGHEYVDQTEENQTFFYQALENWTVLNLSESFDVFKTEIKPRTIVTLPQLILEKDRIVGTLIKHLKLKNPLCLQPLLELVIAVAKDLRKDFYPYYKQILEILIDLLATKDTEQLEWTFTCLAYIFKFLWRPLIKDIATVFETLLPLLSTNKPEYINNFAAGSFAFVARKVKDRHSFLKLILKTVKTHKDGIEGCGRLLFEVIHGVQGQFHSCANEFLDFILDSLLDPDLNQELLFEIVDQMLGHILQEIEPLHQSGLLWTSFIRILDKLETNWRGDNQDLSVAPNLELVLKLFGHCIEFKSGKFLYNNNPLVVKQIIKLLSNLDLPETTLLVLTQIVILLLLSKNVKLSQEQASGLCKNVLALPRSEVLLYFVDNVKEFTSFEALILPQFLKYCLGNDFETKSLNVLVKLVLKKAPLARNGIGLNAWARYPLEFGGTANNCRVETNLVDKLKVISYDDPANYFNALICLPHLALTQKGVVCEDLGAQIDDLLMRIAEDNGNKKKYLFLLNTIVESLVYLRDVEVLKIRFFSILDCILPLAETSIWALNIVDLLATTYKDDPEIVTMSTLLRLNQHLAPNFNSPYHEFRLVTTHLYQLFEDLPEFDLRHSDDPDVPPEKFAVFSICHRVESIDPQVQTYRDQLQNLQKLNYDKPQMLMCQKTEFRTIPLRYLCGSLYFNFKLLWDPTAKIIESQAYGLKINEFWDIYGEQLRNAVRKIETSEEYCVDSLATSCESLGSLFQRDQEFKMRSDFANYRLLLWKTLGLFPEIAESKTKDVSQLFLDFIGNEYNMGHADSALLWNIKQNSTKPPLESSGGDDDEDNDKIENKRKARGKTAFLLLLNGLRVFGKVRSPKSLYREPELNKLFFDLLQHRNADVQKAALDCIMTYKHKYLTPYKTNLYNLIDEQKFKNELASFRIDKQSDVILPDHRPDLIPIIMKIVFSKMKAKIGLRTGGKSAGQLRRNLVFRFLAGCETSEMLSFLRVSFSFYNQFLTISNDDVELMVDKISSTIDLEKFIAPKRLQSSLNLLNVVLEQFGCLMAEELLSFILQITLVIGALIQGALRLQSEIYPGYLAMLKNLKTVAIRVVEKFFNQFDRYRWNNKEINAVFNTFIWPYLDKLNTEGIHSPTALLKLLIQWGSNPRYFSLLVKSDRLNNYALPHIISLLLNEKSQKSVVSTIEDMIQKLMSLQADEEDLVELTLPVDNLLPIRQDILERVKVDEKLNYGSCILLPHVSQILTKIKQRLEGKSKGLNPKELFILSRISELVWEPELCHQTLKLLLPIVLKRCVSNSGEELIVQLLGTVDNLLKSVTDPVVHLKVVSALFAEVQPSQGRKLLVKILTTVAGNNPDLIRGLQLVEGLNAWDVKWVDQPDFQRRHDTFKLIETALEDGKVNSEIGILLIHNFFYLMKSEKDLALRENSSFYLRKLSKYLLDKYRNTKENDHLLNDILFNLIRAGFKSKNQDFRTESIQFLGYLARECPQNHLVLADLNRYSCKEDLEVDFFENLTHLQIHRHARALLKFTQVTRELDVAPNIRTLTQFILPLTTFYLCNEKYSNKNSLVDAAIESLSTISRILSWHHYEWLLKFYLGEMRRKIDYQKQLVRVTVAILDAFHFDLSKGLAESVTVAQTQAQDQAQSVNQNEAQDQTKAEAQDQTEAETQDQTEAETQDQTEAEAQDQTEAEAQDEEQKEEDDLEEPDSDLDDNEDDPVEVPVVPVKICDKITVLCKSTATRVTRIIQIVLLPQLHNTLAQMTHHETAHKVNRRKVGSEREEEELLKVPISLALVKLLQRLPKAILDLNLPGIFMKLCTFLKSHMESVRRVARETLQKIMQSLGPKYLDVMLREITPLLTRGFQAHVLVYTTFSVLNCLKDRYEPGDIDRILLTVLDLCKSELFGILSDEKDVAKIGIKTSEAKSTKSFEIFQILAQFITEKCLMDLLLPLKTVLNLTQSFRIVSKAQECLRRIALGLVDNNFIAVEDLIKFAYGTASERIPELTLTQDKPELSEKQREKLKRQRPDCFIIPKAPVGKSGIRLSTVKTSAKANAHLLVEFGLRLCLILLKRDRLKDEAFRGFLDPFVGIFKNCLKSKHVKLSAITLNCLSWVLKYDLPSTREHVEEITTEIFAILHKFAAAGLSKGDNFDLVVAAFKAMAVLVRDVKYYTIKTEQLQVLLLYVEQDVHDYDRQATAFNLLKAIISRKLIVPEIHDVMMKVAELSVTSELDHVRVQSRQVFHQYFLDYPLGARLDKYLSFYISQAGYELKFGRESALEMLQTIVNTFPLKVLKEHSGTIFVTLGVRLVNDDLPECRKMVADCITDMLRRLTKSDRDSLFDIIGLWFKDKNLSHRQLAAQLCGLMVTVEKTSFETRLTKVMDLLLYQFGLDQAKPGRYVRPPSDDSATNDDDDNETGERIRDHYLFQLLQLLLKISAQCPSFLKRKQIKSIAENVQNLLNYAHDWVRLGAAQFLGFVLSSLDIKNLTNLILNNDSKTDQYLNENPIDSVKKLTLDLCDQLQPGDIKSDLAEQVIKNLVFVARVLETVPLTAPPDNSEKQKINLLWLAKRMRQIVNREVVEAPSSTVLRTEVFKWIAGIGSLLDTTYLTPILKHLLAPLVREMITTEKENAALRQLAKEVGSLFKKKLGLELYTKTLSELQMHLSAKRAERKRTRTQLAVTEPEVFARKKIRTQERKKEAKKRRMAERKGVKVKKGAKKRKMVSLEPDDF